MINSCNILGVSNVCIFVILQLTRVDMLDEKDHRYTTNINEILGSQIWDIKRVHDEIRRILTKTTYHYVLLMLPDESQHAHHQLSCLFTLEVLDELKKNKGNDMWNNKYEIQI